MASYYRKKCFVLTTICNAVFAKSTAVTRLGSATLHRKSEKKPGEKSGKNSGKRVGKKFGKKFEKKVEKKS